MDWKKLKQEYFEQCCDGFVETHFGETYRRMKLSPSEVFDWFRNKLDTDTFCLICNEWHPEGACMKCVNRVETPLISEMSPEWTSTSTDNLPSHV